jgi:hypothetical protein
LKVAVLLVTSRMLVVGVWVSCPAAPESATTLADWLPCIIKVVSALRVGEPTSVQPVNDDEANVSKSELLNRSSTTRVSSLTLRWRDG